MIDQELFKQACVRIINLERRKNGIGTLGEKTLHSVLKCYFEPDEERHEAKVGGFVADIVGENGIIEIQTRQFNRLRKKLPAFLDVCHVTVVYPVAQTKWLFWIDEQTGGVSEKRKSPRSGQPYDIYKELYRIKMLLKHPNLSFCIVMLELEEYRRLSGWSSDKKKGSERYDRIPVDLKDVININSTKDYNKIIPDSLPERFTSKNFKKASGLSLSASQTALNILTYIEAVRRVDKQGNLYVYEKII